MTPLLHGHLDIGRSLYGPAGDGAVPVVIATVLFETLVGPLSNYIPSVASCHIVGGVCWVQDDGPATQRDDALPGSESHRLGRCSQPPFFPATEHLCVPRAAHQVGDVEMMRFLISLRIMFWEVQRIGGVDRRRL